MGEYILCSFHGQYGFIYLNSIAIIIINAQLLYKTIQLHSSPLSNESFKERSDCFQSFSNHANLERRRASTSKSERCVECMHYSF